MVSLQYVETIVHIDSNPYISWLVNKAFPRPSSQTNDGNRNVVDPISLSFLFLCLQLHHPVYLRLTCLKMLSYSRRDEKAGRQTVWGLANSWNRAVNYACFHFGSLSLQSERGFSSAARTQRGRDTRGRQFVHICSPLRSFPTFWWEKKHSFHCDQYEIIHNNWGINLTRSQECFQSYP